MNALKQLTPFGVCEYLLPLFLLLFLSTFLRGQTTLNFNYTGNMQTWTVPSGVAQVYIEATGAQGGVGQGENAFGGFGGRATGDLSVTPGQTLYIFVGGRGQTAIVDQVSGGGWNGGGNAFSINGGLRGGGGGASDVRVNGTSLNNRVIVGGGGGGTS